MRSREFTARDRNFCTLKFLFGIWAKDTRFVVRRHGQFKDQLLGNLRLKETTERGEQVDEHALQITFEGCDRHVTRMTVKLHQPTRDRSTELHNLTNLTAREVHAVQGTDLSQQRWTIETVFLQGERPMMVMLHAGRNESSLPLARGADPRFNSPTFWRNVATLKCVPQGLPLRVRPWVTRRAPVGGRCPGEFSMHCRLRCTQAHDFCDVAAVVFTLRTRDNRRALSTPNGHLMELDDEVCLCFHVSKRKLLSYMRINKARMRRASQLSECSGAGTGCGWCVGYLKWLFAQQNPEAAEAEAAHHAEPTSGEHRAGRTMYLKQKEEG